MSMDADRYPRRKSPRLKDYDYAQSGAYFVTICTYQRRMLFGHIVDDQMVLSAIGHTVAGCWAALPEHFPSVELDLWVIMPNHIHGILMIMDDDAHSTHSRTTLGQIVNSFKGSVTRIERKRVNDDSLNSWQGRYHDHIIRSESSLNKIRAYILSNPARWHDDTFYGE